MSKSELVRTYAKSGQWKDALRIAKDFRIGVSKEQRSVMARAYECIVHPAFYQSIGKYGYFSFMEHDLIDQKNGKLKVAEAE